MSATEKFNELVAKKIETMVGVPEDERRTKAIIAIARSNPQLHREYLSETNPGPKAQRLLAEKG